MQFSIPHEIILRKIKNYYYLNMNEGGPFVNKYVVVTMTATSIKLILIVFLSISAQSGGI